jgi:hypothetical protein
MSSNVNQIMFGLAEGGMGTSVCVFTSIEADLEETSLLASALLAKNAAELIPTALKNPRLSIFITLCIYSACPNQF